MRKQAFTLLLSIPAFAFSQSLSIDELWKRVEQTQRYKQEELKVQMAQEELNQDKINRLPIFYADANVQRNLIIPSTPVPAIAFNPNAQEGAILPLKFATKWSSKAGIQLEWNIFNPQNKLTNTQNKLNLEKSKLTQQEQLEDLRKDATLTYASIVLATLQYDKARKDSATYAEILQITKERYEAGRTSSAEYITAQQEMERKKIQLIESWSVLEEASIELRNSLNLEDIEHISSDIGSIVSLLDPIIYTDYQKDLLKIDEQLAQVQINQIRRQRLPSLTFNTYVGAQYFNNSFAITKSENWFGNSFANIALHVPLSDWVWQNPQLKKASLQQKISNLQIQEQEILDQTKSEQKNTKKQATQEKIKRLEYIYQLANQHLEEQQAAYEYGKILLSDYNKAILDVHKAQQDIWQAQYDYIKILLEKA